ncbi:hypothetical protein [Phaeovulum vinaykumarii]|uniref:Uncharacterized protein n=1 Tax=Phaeovulum vinaykumarii TaxID=407234 RepID=A0A1N7LTG9_9RHOB|nr:hypothetical protein [Phaeovulum vinaykumarii]SIS77145.1 hypothetical protein SAMN05421795_10495 [Phaeovulum vinaykumarii]SOC07573.1 hypothetical protein SAMN05878426_104159 [Phaeovulum vinaykumarii]
MEMVGNITEAMKTAQLDQVVEIEDEGPYAQLPLTEIIARHQFIEHQCDTILAEQEDLSRAYYARIGRAHSEAMKAAEGRTTLPRLFHDPAAPELLEIEELEGEIRIYRFQLQTVQNVIFETEPQTVNEAVAKLKFLSRAMADGVDFEVDYFAYMIEECADIIGMKR